MDVVRCEAWKNLEPAPKKFQKLVIQTLLQKDKCKSSEPEEFELPQFIGTKLELTKKGITILPNQLLRFAEFVECMYLDGNKLIELPDNFFQSLRHLKWLDLRNNELIKLPTVGLKNHPVLEFLLLQGNRIKYLPTELGFVPNLKGLQIAGNPIQNVPYEVIANGFLSIITYLRKIKSQEDILLPNSDGITVRPSTIKVVDDKTDESILEDIEDRAEEKQSKSNETNISKLTNQDPVPINVTKGYRKLMRSKMCSKPKQRIISSSHHKPWKFRFKYGYKSKMVTPEMVEERAKKEAEIAKKKETLEKQAQKIQRMKDKEMLKTWRRQTQRNAEQLKLLDNYQHYPSRNFIYDTPFDVDPEFLNMLNRIDLYRSLKEMEAMQKRRRKGDPKFNISISDLERQMKDIKKSLESLSLTYEGENSPRTKQSHLCKKIAQMKDIQKTLKNLQYKNVSISGSSTLLNGNTH